MSVSSPITTITTILRYFFWDHLGEPVPEENFWTLCCNGRLTEADTPTIWLSATPSGITSAHLHHPPLFTGWMPFLPTNQQHQSTEGKSIHTHTHTTVFRPFFREHPGEQVPEENFWTLWCKGRLTEADTSTIRLGATPPSPHFFTGRMPFLTPNRQQHQSTEGKSSG